MKTNLIAIVGVLGVIVFAGCAGTEESYETTTEPLVGGSSTNARPEVGYLSTNCTGTLVAANYIITAAHCFGYTNGPRNDTFQMKTTAGVDLPPSKVDYAYMTGTALGDWDFAFGRLATPVLNVSPAGIGGAPTGNEQVSAFGYGCTNRGTHNDAGIKRFIDYTYGNSTQMNCPVDSGGPRFHGFHTGTGAIWGINSGYDGDGNDILANAWAYAPAVLRGVKWFGGTTTTDTTVSTFPGKTSQTGVKVVAGDFNNDGLGDLAAVGNNTWTTVPVAFGDGNGGFTVTNLTVGQSFPTLASQAKSVVAADFDGDGATDIALLGGIGWTTIPIAFSNWDGTFRVTNQGVPNLPGWSQQSGVKAVAGDFDGDGDGDIALLGGSGWGSIPMGFSNRDGTFVQTNTQVANFPGWAALGTAKAFAGDFDGDGDADIALTGPASWGSIPVAFSDRHGGFTVTNNAVSDFPGWASIAGVKLAVGDFDGDGDADLADLGVSGWRGFGFALSNGSGGFLPASVPNPDFAAKAALNPFVLAVKTNRDGAADLVLTGASGATTLPVAYLKPSPVITQSSTILGGTADRAFDGNTDGNWGDGSVTHTDFESQPWWQVDLGVLTRVTWVEIYNRTDCCADRLTNFNVSISANGSSWSTINTPGTAGPQTNIVFNGSARYVKVQLLGTNNLSLAEVKVKQ
jgi:hypothetical protein